MSSGESDAYRPPPSLDEFRKCGIPGCVWRVLGDRVCYQHGGRKAPQYVCDSEGAIVDTRFMPR